MRVEQSATTMENAASHGRAVIRQGAAFITDASHRDEAMAALIRDARASSRHRRLSVDMSQHSSNMMLASHPRTYRVPAQPVAAA